MIWLHKSWNNVSGIILSHSIIKIYCARLRLPFCFLCCASQKHSSMHIRQHRLNLRDLFLEFIAEKLETGEGFRDSEYSKMTNRSTNIQLKASGTHESPKHRSYTQCPRSCLPSSFHRYILSEGDKRIIFQTSG